MFIIYRKSDLVCVDKADYRTPEEQIKEYIRLNAPNTLPQNYGVVETNLKHFHLETIGVAVTVVEDIPEPETPEPTEADYLLDLDFRLSMVELGL